MLLADEGLNGNIVRELRDLGLELEWIAETTPGIPDDEVIEIAKEKSKILITEDKDFGEWVFAHKIGGLTIIFLRYEKQDYDQIIMFLKELVLELSEEDQERFYQFITINKNKVRKRII